MGEYVRWLCSIIYLRNGVVSLNVVDAQQNAKKLASGKMIGEMVGDTGLTSCSIWFGCCWIGHGKIVCKTGSRNVNWCPNRHLQAPVNAM